jgi:hypothetical protein
MGFWFAVVHFVCTTIEVENVKKRKECNNGKETYLNLWILIYVYGAHVLFISLE